MTKREARAWLAFQRAINKACDNVVAKLPEDQRYWAEAYAVGHIRSAANGQGYGSAPIIRAEEALEA